MAISSAASSTRRGLPKEIVDAHHHFFDTNNNDFNENFLRILIPNTSYRPDDYQRDVVDNLAEHGIKLVGSVHVEAVPDDGFKEAEWVASVGCGTGDIGSTVAAIVASCDLASPNAEAELKRLRDHNPKVKGIRWILDCVGPFEPDTATHIATTRNPSGKHDYLRGSAGGYDGDVLPEFERGFALLSLFGFSFDLQCAPVQLTQAAALCSRYPQIPVCIDHLGKPRPASLDGSVDDENLKLWRVGMDAMARLPNTYVKISMLGYVIPGWIESDEKIAAVKRLVRETVVLFGPKRCMVALNWHVDAAVSDSDGRSTVGPDPVEFVQHLSSFFEDYSEEDRDRIFAGTAREFYSF